MLQSLHMAGTRRGENVCTLTEAAGCDVAGMGLAEFSYGEAACGRGEAATFLYRARNLVN